MSPTGNATGSGRRDSSSQPLGPHLPPSSPSYVHSSHQPYSFNKLTILPQILPCLHRRFPTSPPPPTSSLPTFLFLQNLLWHLLPISDIPFCLSCRFACASQLNQSGDGHFSPVGGFHAPSDHVLLMDVARFKYPPHWVPIVALYEAMSLLDPESGVPRGALVLSSSAKLKPALFSLEYAISAEAAAAQTGGPWALQKLLSEALPALAASALKEQEEVQAESPSSARQKAVLRGLASAAAALPKEAASMINVRTPGGCGTPGSSCSKGGASELLLAEIRCMPLYQVRAVFRAGVRRHQAAGTSAGPPFSLPCPPPTTPVCRLKRLVLRRWCQSSYGRSAKAPLTMAACWRSGW